MEDYLVNPMQQAYCKCRSYHMNMDHVKVQEVLLILLQVYSYISQAQGKIFQYTNGLVNIADQGMKQWFNKYLPSILLSQFPGMEDCDSWIDNPVAGVGCQSVYDPNYDLVYFSKKDYECTLPECIDYVPCEGFVYNNTTCNNVPPTPCCPDGFTYNPSNPPGEECERITTEPADVTAREGQVDIVFNVDSSNSIASGNNTGNVQNFMRTFIDLLQVDNLITNGNVRVGLVHFGGGRAVASPLFNGQTSLDNPPVTAFDEMFEQSNQVTLTNDINLINQWVGTPGNWNGTFYNPDLTSIYGSAVGIGNNPGIPPRDRPYGTDILGGIWCSQNLLYGLGARVVPKVLITIFDGAMSVAPNNALTATCNYFYTSTPYTLGGIGDGVTQSDVYAPLAGGPSMTVPDPALAGSGALQTPDVNWPTCPPLTNIFTQVSTTYDAVWFDNNVRNGYTQLAPFNQRSYSIVVDPGGQIVTQNPHLDYAERFAGGGGLTQSAGTYGGNFENVTEIQDIATQIIEQVTPPPTVICPPGCDIITTNAGQYFCECKEYLPATFIDNTTPVSIEDKTYFKDVSWTVSYDPKYKAWMSFHDWHPELVIPSLNHFFTTNTYEDLDSDPNCPPGFIWNPTTQTCCQTLQGEVEADIIVEEVPVEVITDVATDCKLDIVIACDNSGSMQGNNWIASRTFIDEFVCALAPDMIAGNTQVGLTFWTTGGGGSVFSIQTPNAVVGTDAFGNTFLQTAPSISNNDAVSMTNNPGFIDNGRCQFAPNQMPLQPLATPMADGYNHAMTVLNNVSGTAQGNPLPAGISGSANGSALG